MTFPCPDKFGNEEDFKELANQFEAFHPYKVKCKNDADDFSQLINIPEILIEVRGSWIWISGDTKTYIKIKLNQQKLMSTTNKALADQ